MITPNNANPIKKLTDTGMANFRSRKSRSGKIGSAAERALTSQANRPTTANPAKIRFRVWPSSTMPTTVAARLSAPK